MILNYDEYRKKVLGCWMGKNIGGTLGAPFEWKRQINNVSSYSQDLGGEPLPNDDLDLQLVWLLALERLGPGLNAHDLAEYWLQHITPHWVEYGIAKTNMRLGLMPPVSGWYGNIYKDSCGAFIRSEIWACVAPGCPSLAARYAYQDAIVDHADEGVYAEVFIAVIESAAFVESDIFTLIDLGLSAIPEDCGVARAVRVAVQGYKEGKAWQACRDDILEEVPSIPEGYVGEPNATFTGYDAPNNIGFTILGLLYGEGDFGESLCITVNCGDDTDCTAATVGSILGITNGIDGIPERWREPIGHKINTITLNRADEGRYPRDIDELTERIVNVAYQVLAFNRASCQISRSLSTDLSDFSVDQLLDKAAIQELLASDSWSYMYDFGILRAWFSYEGEPTIQSNTSKKVKLTLERCTPCQQSLSIRWHLPDGFSVEPADCGVVLIFSDRQSIEMELCTANLREPTYRGFVEVVSNGHPTVGIIPFVLLNGDYNTVPYRMPHVRVNEI